MALSETYLSEALKRLFDARMLQSVIGGDPAAGAEISVTVPGGEFWEVLSVVYTFVTSAVVSNRRSVLVFDNGTLTNLRSNTATDQTASLTVIYTFAGVGARANDLAQGDAMGMLPTPVYCAPGSRIRTATLNLDAGDNYGAPTIYARRYSPTDLASVASDIENELRATVLGGIE